MVPEEAFEIVLNVACLGILGSWATIVLCQLRLLSWAKKGLLQRPSFRMFGAPYSGYLVLVFLAGVLVLVGFDYPVGTWTVGSIAVIIPLLIVGWFLCRARITAIAEERAGYTGQVPGDREPPAGRQAAPVRRFGRIPSRLTRRFEPQRARPLALRGERPHPCPRAADFSPIAHAQDVRRNSPDPVGTVEGGVNRDHESAARRSRALPSGTSPRAPRVRPPPLALVRRPTGCSTRPVRYGSVRVPPGVAEGLDSPDERRLEHARDDRRR